MTVDARRGRFRMLSVATTLRRAERSKSNALGFASPGSRSISATRLRAEWHGRRDPLRATKPRPHPHFRVPPAGASPLAGSWRGKINQQFGRLQQDTSARPETLSVLGSGIGDVLATDSFLRRDHAGGAQFGNRRNCERPKVAPEECAAAIDRGSITEARINNQNRLTDHLWAVA
jgi:hypothetical protein